MPPNSTITFSVLSETGIKAAKLLDAVILDGEERMFGSSYFSGSDWMVMTIGLLGELGMSKSLTAMAVIVCWPLPRALSSFTLKAPSLSVVVVVFTCPLLEMIILVLAGPVPITSGLSRL